MGDTVLRERRDAIGILTLNRPERLNALSLELVRELTAALHELEADAAVRVVLLRGAGKAWCAGGDVEELLALTRGPAAARRRGARGSRPLGAGVRAGALPRVIAAAPGEPQARGPFGGRVG